MDYPFETPEFGLSDAGIHLLRSRFNYESIDWDQTNRAKIESGKELNNWIIVLTLGLTLLLFSIYYVFKFVLFLLGDNETQGSHVILVEELLIPLLPTMMGVYCIYASLKTGTLWKVVTINGRKLKFPLKEIERDGKQQQLAGFLQQKLSNRFAPRP